MALVGIPKANELYQGFDEDLINKLLNAPIERQYKQSQILENLLKDPRERQKLEQERIANEQLNQYRMGQLAQQKISDEMSNRYRMGELGLKREELPNINELRKAQADYYRSGGGAKGGVDNQNRIALAKQAILDNPGMTADQANDVTNAWLEGRTTLKDGSQVPEPSGQSKYLMSSMGGRETTSALWNQRVQAEQAEAELPVYDKYINEGVQPYADTVLGETGISFQQIKDTLNTSDDAAQKRLGKYIGAQQLLTDRAALTLKINALPAGVRMVDEIKKISHQSINAKYPQLSAKARKEASDYTAKALIEGFNARKNVNIKRSQIYSKNDNKNEAVEQEKEKSPKLKREVWTRDANGNPIQSNK